MIDGSLQSFGSRRTSIHALIEATEGVMDADRVAIAPNPFDMIDPAR